MNVISTKKQKKTKKNERKKIAKWYDVGLT